ncbi:MAG: minor capsid protein [Bacillota bacterium]|nr:minor capsid protein [Bacillota bacterium]
MKPHEIKTPRGALKQVVGKNGKVTAKLEWNSGFGPNYTAKLNSVQAWIDNEVLRRCDPLVPFKTGMLKKSGILFTDVGSGTVEYNTPYASALYYGEGFSFSGAPQRGAYWFERMKNNGGREAILSGAKKLIKK